MIYKIEETNSKINAASVSHNQKSLEQITRVVKDE
jgi:hypothetical protein